MARAKLLTVTSVLNESSVGLCIDAGHLPPLIVLANAERNWTTLHSIRPVNDQIKQSLLLEFKIMLILLEVKDDECRF